MKDVLRLLKPKIHGKPRNIFLGVRNFLFLVPCGDTRYSLKHVLLQVITPQGISESANFRFLQRLSVIFGFRRDCPRSLASCRDYRPRKMASCRDCPCDSASCRESRHEPKSHGQSPQEAIYQAQQSRQEARCRGQSRRKPNNYDGQSLTKAKISGLVYTLCTLCCPNAKMDNIEKDTVVFLLCIIVLGAAILQLRIHVNTCEFVTQLYFSR